MLAAAKCCHPAQIHVATGADLLFAIEKMTSRRQTMRNFDLRPCGVLGTGAKGISSGLPVIRAESGSPQ
jgi:hypothetical protein